MSEPVRTLLIRLADAQGRIPGPAGEHATGVMQRGALDVKLSMPRPPNRQAPHAQDEIYVIVRGRGVLVTDRGREAFGPGDLMFVAAGEEHHFEDFTDDIAVWVIFNGPVGGEFPLGG